MIAWVNPISLPVQLLRDSWFVYPFIIAFKKNDISLIILFYILFIGILLFIFNFSVKNLQLFLYSFRDYSLIILVCQLLMFNSQFNLTKKVLNFINFVIIIAVISSIIQFINPALVDFIYQKNEYFINKGVSTNLGFGLFGERLMHPFYSPNLLGEFLFFIFLTVNYKFLTKFKYKKVAIVIGLLTLTKSFIINIIFKYFKSKALFIIISGITGVFLIYTILLQYVTTYSDLFLINHVYSIIGHLNAFSHFYEFFKFVPTYFGEKSVLNNVLRGVVEPGIESTLLARLYEIKIIFSIPFIVYLLYVSRKLKEEKKILFLCFITLLFLTSTANHPIIIIPAIYLLNEKRSSYL